MGRHADWSDGSTPRAKAAANRRRFLIVHNPTAGLASRGRRLHMVIADLKAAGCEVALCRSRSPAETESIVRSAVASGYDAVVAAGGDGTVRGVASVLIGTGMPLGIVPAGTANVMAHEIGLRLRSDAIADCLMHGGIAHLRTSYANGEPFFLMVGAGFDGRVTSWLDTAFKRRVGKLAYTWPVLRGVIAGPDTLRVRVDDQEHNATWAIVTVSKHYAGAFLLAPTASLKSSRMQAVLFRARNRWSMLGQLLETAAGRIVHRSDIDHVPGSTVEITSERPVPVQIDGEPFGSTPVSIRTGGPVLNLIVPARTSSLLQARAGRAAPSPEL